MNSGKKKPSALYVLVFLLFFQAVAGLYGGFSLVFDPSGALLKMGDEVLGNTPFKSFLIPGLILGVVLGLIPMLLIYPLLARPHWPWARRMNIYKNRYWAWTCSLYIGLAVIIWIDVQIFMIGYSQLIQTIIAALGVLIVIFTLWPSVMMYFRSSRNKSVNDAKPANDNR